MEDRELKNKFWKGVLVGALVMALAGLLIVGVSAGIFLIGRTVIDNKAQIRVENSSGASQETGSAAGPAENRLNLGKVSSKMRYIQQIIDAYFLFDQDPEKMEEGIYMGMMYGLEDPYSVYYNEEDLTSLLEETSGEYCGIGVMVQQNYNTGIITAVRVFEGSPALEAGMLPGDILYKVEDELISGKELDLVVKEDIRGEEGTFVNLTVLRGDAADQVELRIERRQIEVPTVEHQMLENQIGYVCVLQFDEVTSGQFAAAVEDLKSQGMEKLIVDMRGNPGGVLDTAVEMLAYILPEDRLDGMLIYTADKNGKGDRYFSKDGQIWRESDSGERDSRYPKKDGNQLDMPLAVLVNGSSASAAEVFTGAIQDYDAGIVVGTTTFGKGIVQNLIPLGDGSGIKLTTAHYYTPDGFDLHGIGLTPDVVVDLDEELKTKAVVSLEEDNQVQAAIKALEEE